MVTAEAFIAWRLTRLDLARLCACGVDVGWAARQDGGVIVVREAATGHERQYETLGEAGAFVDGWLSGARPREHEPTDP